MIATTTAPTAAKLARVANALADQHARGLFTVGTESLSAVTVCPGEFRAFEIIEGDGLVVGEARGAAAAFGIALDRLTAPIMGAHQHAHDSVSV
jgi:hypothetical protein